MVVKSSIRCVTRGATPVAADWLTLLEALVAPRLTRLKAAALTPFVGATATGKSALAVTLAQRLDGEVVNADALQFYRGMDIGTAKVTEAEREGVPHHLLDLWHVREPASVAEYRQRARAEIRDLLKAKA